jgi:hypothetical protein
LTPAVETTNNTYNISNINGAKVVNYYDMLNNQRLVDFNINCTSPDYEDWIYHKDILRGSVLQSYNHYQYNWVHIRSFEEVVAPMDEDLLPSPYQNLIHGLDLSQEQKYDWVGTTVNSGFNHYAFSICSKILQISQNGIMLM